MQFSLGSARLAALVVGLASIGLAATPAAADPTCTDVPACVPGLELRAAEGKPCAAKGADHRYVLGIDASYPNTRNTYICARNYRTGVQGWSKAPPLYGVMRAGEVCRPGWSAQDVDGRPMACGEDGTWFVNLNSVA